MSETWVLLSLVTRRYPAKAAVPAGLYRIQFPLPQCLIIKLNSGSWLKQLTKPLIVNSNLIQPTCCLIAGDKRINENPILVLLETNQKLILIQNRFLCFFFLLNFEPFRFSNQFITIVFHNKKIPREPIDRF